MTPAKTHEAGEKLKRFFFSLVSDTVGEGHARGEQNRRVSRSTLTATILDFRSLVHYTTTANSIVIVDELGNEKIRNNE